MIFYRSDGSINFTKTDREFGWDISDSSTDHEDVPTIKHLLKKLLKDNAHQSLQIGYLEEITTMLITVDTFESNILLSIISKNLFGKLRKNRDDIDSVDMNMTKIRNDPRDSVSVAVRDPVIKSEDWKCSQIKKNRRDVGVELANIDKTLRNFSDNAHEMQRNVQEIKKCFSQQHSRIDQLLSECTTYRQDLLETKYIDDIINLLQNNLLPTKRNWPFKIVNHSDEETTNYII